MDRKGILIGADLFIAVISLTLAIAAQNGNIAVWLVLAVLAIRSIGTAFLSIRSTKVPATIPKMAFGRNPANEAIELFVMLIFE
mgnify:CR=1 FL=1